MQHPNLVPMLDYRTSHVLPNKGRSYDATFQNLAYRKIVWKWEQDVLCRALHEIRSQQRSIKYLDFACGTGRILGFLEEDVDESFGVDVSSSMLEVAKQKSKKSKLILADLTHDELFEPCSLDLVTAFRFFLNAQSSLKEEALHAIYRILRANGYLIFNIHMNKGCLLEGVLRAYHRVRHIRNENFASISIKETKSLLASANFEVIGLCHYGVLPIYYENQRFLIKFIDIIERLFSRNSAFQSYSRYIIYICRKRA
jgi:ubiquinone/menaquinone biosynthesis C-methylase UbiE